MNISACATSARLPQLDPGEYVVRLTVTNDGGLTSYRETHVKVKLNSGESYDNTGLIVGLVMSLVANLILAAAVAFMLYR